LHSNYDTLSVVWRKIAKCELIDFRILRSVGWHKTDLCACENMQIRRPSSKPPANQSSTTS
jgi:hypothetical protein